MLYYTWKDEELALQVASMHCLIALIKTDDFEEAMKFLDKMNSLPGGSPVRSRKKYLVINTTSQFDSSQMQNKTGNINVHIVKKGEGDKFSVKVVDEKRNSKYYMYFR